MVFHCRGAPDELEAVDALQGLAYVAEYMVAGVRDPAQVGLRVVAPRLTERFIQQVHLLGGTLDATARRGVHDGMLGRFALRVVETSVACDAPREEVLRVLSPRFLTEDMALRPVDERERALYNRMHRCIEQLSRSPEGAMAKDVDLVAKRWERDVAKMLPRMDPKVVLAELTPEQRLAGLAPDEAVRALPLEVLRALSEEYVRTLSLETQTLVRARRGA